jgi:predicted DsbA family dithiol-disulfide isomerase
VKKHLVVHPQVATTGALAFCAADKQGKAAQMDELLWEKEFKARAFDTDQCWTGGTCEKTNALASELQLDLDKFKEDMKGCQTQVQGDMKELQKFGVGATPGFFINGRFISGAVPMENFVQVIDEEVKKADEKIAAGTPAAQYYQQVVIGQGLKGLEPVK